VAVKIRLKRLGKIRSPHYRIVVMDSRAKRDGRAIEEIGLYHPKNDPSVIRVDSDRAQYWLGVGAQPTEAVVAILKRTGDWQQFSGDTSPSGVKPQPQKPDKLIAYNAAGGAEAAGEAIAKPKRGGRKAAQGDAAESNLDVAPVDVPAADEPAAPVEETLIAAPVDEIALAETTTVEAETSEPATAEAVAEES
jgi:small subunit ribosomal protein S16